METGSERRLSSPMPGRAIMERNYSHTFHAEQTKLFYRGSIFDARLGRGVVCLSNVTVLTVGLVPLFKEVVGSSPNSGSYVPLFKEVVSPSHTVGYVPLFKEVVGSSSNSRMCPSIQRDRSFQSYSGICASIQSGRRFQSYSGMCPSIETGRRFLSLQWKLIR
ncbi:hypothetical protein MAR_033054 [Mya arenaria]|uniref:Uncharacterized protein n=1 Tax=Mya arenaria TaxID=6604 RepID=A0ABY7G9C8_MYAAR|nr:hypothetical protein MAR_033054 [Mya arenaria]